MVRARTAALCLAALGSLLAGVPGHAAPPTFDALLPAGGKVGTAALEVTAIGKFDPWPVEVWCSNPEVKIAPDPEKSGQLSVSVADQAALGPCLVRLFNAEGVSEPRIFVVGTLPEIREDEKADNDRPAEPQVVETLPVVVNGRLEKSQDVDAYRVGLKKGQLFTAHLDGYSLRSGIDPFLHLYDPDGNRIALKNDNPRNLDPRLDHTAERDGDYTVAVMAISSPPNSNVSFHGASNAVYRLTFSNDPKTAPPKFDPSFPAEDSPFPKEAMKPPAEIYGTLAKPGEVDRHIFTAAKGETWVIKAEAFTFGFPTDPVLIPLRADGTEISQIDDTKPTVDAVYPYRIPADGEYTVLVTDRFRKGGPNFRYRLTIRKQEPDFTATADGANYQVEAGKSAEIKLKLTRLGGHKAPLKIEIEPLPPGVTFAQPEVPEKTGDITLKLEAKPDAKPGNQPIRIRIVETEGDAPANREAVFSFQDSTSRGPYLIEETADLWLTVTPAAKPEAKKE